MRQYGIGGKASAGRIETANGKIAERALLAQRRIEDGMAMLDTDRCSYWRDPVERENYYILLELSYQPPADDPAQILAALEVKKQQWTRLLEVPGKRSQALRYLEMVPDIEGLMLDEAARQSEAQAAAVLCSDQLRRFEAELRVLEGKGHVTPRELNVLTVKYSSFGATKEAAEQLLQVPLSEHPPLAAERGNGSGEMIDRITAGNIQRDLQLLGHKDLYAFLGAGQRSAIAELIAAAQTKQAEAQHSAVKSAKVAAVQELADICARLFDSPDNKQRYDRYLQVSVYPALGELIDDQYSRVGYISPDTLLRLVHFGVETYGAKVLEMQDYIKQYCAAYGIVIDTKGNAMPCPACKNDTKRDAAVCATCGAPLFGECPGCGTRFEEGPAVCASCGFSIAEMVKALQHLGEAENALIENNWSLARRGLDYAQKYWPGHPKTQVLERRATRLEEEYDTHISQIEDCVEQNRYYAAQELIDQAQARRIRIPQTVAGQVSSAIAQLETEIKQMRSQPHRITFEAISALTAMVSDSIELTRMFAKYPPEEVPDIAVRLRHGEAAAVVVSWGKSPATGALEYVLVRKAQSSPKTPVDGEVLYEGGATTFTDQAPPPLVTLYYSVFVRRGTAFSKNGLCAQALMYVPEVQNLSIMPVDQGAQLTWDFNPQIQEVRIWRKLGGGAPRGPEEGIEMECPRLEAYTDMRLKNDIEYWYYVVAVYLLGDKKVCSQGVYDNVVPHKLISPVDGLKVIPTGKEDEYVASWDNSQDAEVMLLATATPPNLPTGRMLPVKDLFQQLQRLQLEAATKTAARFRYAVSGGIYIVAATVMGRFAAISEACYLTNVRDVTRLHSDIIGSDLFLNFKWPVGDIQEVVVAWRHDRFPKHPEETGATMLVCSRDHYDYDAGVLLRQSKPEKYYIKVFAMVAAADGTKTYSPGKEIRVDNTPQMELSYQIRYIKPFFSSNRTIAITLRASARSFAPPPAVLVGKIGRLPLTPADGVELFRLEKQIPINDALTYEYHISALPQDLYVRLFFLDEKQYDRIRLLPDMNLKLT